MPLLLAALVPYLVLVVAHWSVGPTVESGDYAQYLLHAKALIEGRPYGDIGYIFTPYAFVIGPPLQPPGFPVTIAPLVALFGTATPLLKGLVVLSGTAFLLLAGLYLARLVGRTAAAVAVAFTGTALESTLATNSVMADLGFCALVWGALLAIDTAERLSVGRIALVTVLGLVAISYRAAGLALVPTLAIHALLDRQRRALALWVVGIWTALAAAVVVVAPEIVPFADQFQQLQHVLDRLRRFSYTVRVPLFESQLYPLSGDRMNDLYHVVSTMVLLVGAAIAVSRQRVSVAWSFAAAYLGMLAVSPVTADRYYWPLYPLAGCCLAIGTHRLANRLVSPKRAQVLATAVLLMIVGGASVRILRSPRPAVLAEFPGIQELYRWFRELGSREPVRVMFANPRVLTLETGVPAMAVVTNPDVGVVLSEIERHGITHVVKGDPAPRVDRSRSMERLLETAAGRLVLEYENSSFAVYRVRSGDPP